MSSNPYQPPSAGVEDPQIVGDDQFLGQPRRREAGAGVEWLSQAWRLFTANPGMWIVFIIMLFGISLVLQFIPLLGGIAQALIMPVLSGGIMIGCDSLRRGGTLEFEHLFAAFKTHTAPLVIVGALYLAAAFAITLVALVPFVGMVGLSALAGGGGDFSGVQVGGMMIGFLLAMALFLPVVAAYWFAPALVTLNNMQPVEAMKLSLIGCFRNFVPFLLYGLIGLVIAIVATLPLALGWLVAAPLFMASIYTGYRDIYYDN